MEFIPAASKRFQAPTHLAPLVEGIERSCTERTWFASATPPRHAKTETLLHAMAWMLLREPRLQIAYITHGITIAGTKSRKARAIAERVGVPTARDMRSRLNWRTGHDDGGVYATGVRGQLTGEGFHVMIIDDPVKGRAAAESAVERDAVWEWLRDDALTRLEPNGSVIVNMARWHPDDVSGRLIAEYGVPYINLPAIGKDGVPLWPDRFSFEALDEVRRHNEYGWNSLYMGEPRGKGQRVFGDTRIGPKPETFAVAIGADFAYSAKSHADYSTAVALARVGSGKTATFHVLEVLREQSPAPAFAAKLKKFSERHGAARIYWDASTTERGMGDLMHDLLEIPVKTRLAKGDPFQRAQPVAGAWNAGRITIPASAPWLNAFLDELASFTGVRDRNDDQVAAFASAFDALELATPIAPPQTTHVSRWGNRARGY
jgi:predicted phage terminase large subunit-like protein